MDDDPLALALALALDRRQPDMPHPEAEAERGSRCQVATLWQHSFRTLALAAAATAPIRIQL